MIKVVNIKAIQALIKRLINKPVADTSTYLKQQLDATK